MERGYDLIVLSKLSNIFCYNGFKMCTFPYLTATSSFVCCNYKKSMQDPERTGTALIQTTEFLFLFTFSSCLVIFVKKSLKKKKELVTNIYGSKLYSVWKSISYKKRVDSWDLSARTSSLSQCADDFEGHFSLLQISW